MTQYFHVKSLILFQVLVPRSDSNCALIWASTHHDSIPSSAVRGGTSGGGGDLFICRVELGGSHYIGKVNPDHKVCYVPRDGEEVSQEHYEILVATMLPKTLPTITTTSSSRIFFPTSPVSKFFNPASDTPVAQPLTHTQQSPGENYFLEDYYFLISYDKIVILLYFVSTSQTYIRRDGHIRDSCLMGDENEGRIL